MAVKITCIKKAAGDHFDPHIAISHLGWMDESDGKTGISDRLTIYDWLKNQKGVAYVIDRFGNKAFVHPREHTSGLKFVQTAADKVWTNNLLELPECK
jgi:Protein of unknown function (DUF3892)